MLSSLTSLLAQEDTEYAESILEDVRWLRPSSDGGDPWFGPVRKTSDEFDLIYACAEHLVLSGDAYVDELSAEEMREHRGTLTTPGRDSPWRERPAEESLELLRSMVRGDAAEGSMVLRAKVDMASPNLNMRDPTLYRVVHAPHENTGDAWSAYPLYDFSHPLVDAVEGVTHSLCTLEFEDHRPLYEWTIDKCRPVLDRATEERGGLPGRPRQIEFSRLNVASTVLSKRRLVRLVESGAVDGWDDPRLPTLSGLRRRGVPAAAVRLFCERVGVSKSDSVIDLADLENCAREVLDDDAPRAFAVSDPLRLTITNWDGNHVEHFEIPRHPKFPEAGDRTVPFGKHLLVEREDFHDAEALGVPPPKGFKRLVVGGAVRLKFAYVVRCDEVVRDDVTNEPTELRCTLFPETRAGVTPPGQTRVKGIVHWVHRPSSVPVTVRVYDRLFSAERPGENDDDDDRDWLDDLRPDSLRTLERVHVEPRVAVDALGVMAELRRRQREGEGGHTLYPSALSYQFERLGYFALDKDSTTDRLVFNRVVTLRDTWGKDHPRKTHKAKDGRRRGDNDSNNNNKNNNAPLDDVRRVALRAGTVRSVEAHPEADSLLVLSVDVGDEDGAPRVVVAGLAGRVDVDAVVGRRVVCLTNLKPARVRGIESRAVLLTATADGSATTELLAAPDDAADGAPLSFEGADPPRPDALLKSKGAVKVWDRVKSRLRTNENGEAAYYSEDGTSHQRLLTRDGDPIKVDAPNAAIG